jgi:hypothetical protein
VWPATAAAGCRSPRVRPIPHQTSSALSRRRASSAPSVDHPGCSHEEECNGARLEDSVRVRDDLGLTTGAAWAQTAELNGKVADQSGAVLPGVTVTVTNTATGLTRTVVTDGDGAYIVSNLPPGRIGWKRRCRVSAPMPRPASSSRSAARRRSTCRSRSAISPRR